MREEIAMNSSDIVLSFVVGLLSGVISSILVTIFYRWKDSEKERQNYFLALRQYVSRLSNISATDIHKTSDFFGTYELPIIYKWIRLKKDEFIMVNKTLTIIMDYQHAFCKLYEKTLRDDEYTEIKLEPDDIVELVKKHALITYKMTEVISLGNKTLTSCKKHKKS